MPAATSSATRRRRVRRHPSCPAGTFNSSSTRCLSPAKSGTMRPGGITQLQLQARAREAELDDEPAREGFTVRIGEVGAVSDAPLRSREPEPRRDASEIGRELVACDRQVVLAPEHPIHRPERLGEGLGARELERGACQRRDAEPVAAEKPARIDGAARDDAPACTRRRCRPAGANGAPCAAHVPWDTCGGTRSTAARYYRRPDGRAAGSCGWRRSCGKVSGGSSAPRRPSGCRGGATP